MWVGVSTGLEVSSTRLISTNKKNCSIFPWSTSVQSKPWALSTLGETLYQYQLFLCSFVKEHDFSAKIKNLFIYKRKIQSAFCTTGRRMDMEMNLKYEWQRPEVAL